ncbi:hypothetical protein V6Z12_A06G007100 [Gossypium hirsutum]
MFLVNGAKCKLTLNTGIYMVLLPSMSHVDCYYRWKMETC